MQKKMVTTGKNWKRLHKRIFEIPLDSERKRMTTVNNFDGERYVLDQGSSGNNHRTL